MIVENAIQIVVPPDVDPGAILVKHKHRATGRTTCRKVSVQSRASRPIRFYSAHRYQGLCTEMGAGIVNIDRMAGIQLEKAADLPAAQGMSQKALFALEEGQLVGHTELVGMPMVKPSPAIRKPGQSIREVVVRRSARR